MSFLWFLEGLRNPFFDKLFLIITELGDEMAFMAIAMIVFWCISKKDGYYILSVAFVGTLMNQFLKLSFRVPRPWLVDPAFTPVEGSVGAATGYSFPSGHTQNAVGTFGSIALFTKKNWIRIVSIIIAVLVAFSRMYLGVHTPLDVGVSIFLAVALVFTMKPIIDVAFDKDSYMYIFIGCMLAFCFCYMVYVHLYPTELIAIDQMHNYESGLKNGYTLLGALIGMLIAYPLEKRFVNFETSAKWYTQIFKVVIGLGLTIGLLELLKLPLNAILPELTIARAIRYALVVIFAVVVYPLSFKLFKRLEDFIESKRRKKA